MNFSRLWVGMEILHHQDASRGVLATKLESGDHSKVGKVKLLLGFSFKLLQLAQEGKETGQLPGRQRRTAMLCPGTPVTPAAPHVTSHMRLF